VEAYIYCNEHHQHANDYYDPSGMMIADSDSAMTLKPITMEPPPNLLGTKQDLRQICYMVALPGGDDLVFPPLSLITPSRHNPLINSICFARRCTFFEHPLVTPVSRHLVT